MNNESIYFIPESSYEDIVNDRTVILEDTGGKFINFKLEFPKRKDGANGRKLRPSKFPRSQGGGCSPFSRR